VIPDHGTTRGAPRSDWACPFCGQRVALSAQRCDQCKLPLDDQTRRSLERLMGPWFVLDPGNPSAPGVTWKKFCALIGRGRITPTSIVRGPATRGLWRLAEDTPSVATRLGLCWSCHAGATEPGAARCAHCGAALEGALDWPGQTDADADADDGAGDPSDSIADLVLAGSGQAARPMGNGAAGAYRRRRSPVVTFFALIVLSGLCGGMAYTVFHMFDEFRLADGLTDPATPHTIHGGGSHNGTAAPDGASPPAHPGAVSGELFPGVPHESGLPRPVAPPTRPAIRTRTKPARTRPAAEPAKTPATRATTAPAAADLAKQRQLTAALFAQSQAAKAKGDLMAAQVILVKMLNRHDRRAWPTGAVEMLEDLQRTIRAADAAPSALELRRQADAAKALFDRASGLIDRNEYLAAQGVLLKILNTYHPKAWPAGAMPAFRKVQKALGAGSTSKPTFFEHEADE